MLKLNASYSKKIPAEGEYSSQSFHASIEVELPDGLTPEQLQGKIHETFEMVRDSVEAELHSQNPRLDGDSDAPDAPKNPPQGSPPGARKNAIPASPKQLQYLLDLARQRGVTPQQIAGRFRLPDLRKLTKQQCSELIDELNGRAA